ncbi:MAG: sensor histidine kinase [Lachnospiraceae bacterium]|nr:sensor histidine kinase [Lachnospiraceae bacterium]
MRKLTDKLILFFLCFLPLLWEREAAGLPVVAAFLAALVVSSLGNALEGEQWKWLGALYCLLGLWREEFVFFLPPVVYDCAGQRRWYVRFLWALPLCVCAHAGTETGELGRFLTALLFCVTGYFLSERTAAHEEVVDAYFQMQDSTREQALYLERKNRELMEKQDYEVRLATLNERNRISREIHDNVGHLLTRSLLLVSAMTVIHGEEEALSGELLQVRETLSEAMDSIRASVHNLHDEAVDLELQLKRLTEEFTFCPVALRYKAGRFPTEVSYCMIAIAKEGLSNIARHSNATAAEISVVEHPAVCQLVIWDNGTGARGGRADGTAKMERETGGRTGLGSGAERDPGNLGGGIGLSNIRERAETLGGNFRVDTEKGFRLFVSIPLPGSGMNT